jgi:hypothetical protein
MYADLGVSRYCNGFIVKSILSAFFYDVKPLPAGSGLL